MNDPRELLSRLAAPFAAEDLEWRLQIAYEDRMQGIAVPYVTNRAIQNRLDDVIAVGQRSCLSCTSAAPTEDRWRPSV